MGERCKLPIKVWGGPPAKIEFGAFKTKNVTWWQQFRWFSWESTDQISCSLHSKGQSGTKILSLFVDDGLK